MEWGWLGWGAALFQASSHLVQKKGLLIGFDQPKFLGVFEVFSISGKQGERGVQVSKNKSEVISASCDTIQMAGCVIERMVLQEQQRTFLSVLRVQLVLSLNQAPQHALSAALEPTLIQQVCPLTSIQEYSLTPSPQGAWWRLRNAMDINRF